MTVVTITRPKIQVQVSDLLAAIRSRIRHFEAFLEKIDGGGPMSLVILNDSEATKCFHSHLGRQFWRAENAIVKFLGSAPLAPICSKLAFVIRHNRFLERAQDAIVFMHKFDERLTLAEAHFFATLPTKPFEFGQPFGTRRTNEVKHSFPLRLLDCIRVFRGRFCFQPR